MTRKDFELIALAISTIREESSRRDAALAIGARLSAVYPRFDAARFVAACKIEQVK